jgi:hypothetical protein
VCSVNKEGVIYCRRMVRQAERSLVNSANGRKGADARWDDHSDTDLPDASHDRGDDHRGDHDGKHDGDDAGDHNRDHAGDHNGNDHGLISLLASSICKGDHLERSRACFERFWVEYPRKVAKKAAWAEWERIRPVPDEAFTAAAMAAVRRQQRTWTDPKYIPHARTWLHNSRWEDEPDALVVSAAEGRVIADADETGRYLDDLRQRGDRR